MNTATLPVAAIFPPEAGWPWLATGWAIHLTAFALVAFHCLTVRREATSALLWIFVAWSFPLIGPLLFLMFGVNRVPQKAWLKRHSDVRFRSERRARQEEILPTAYWRAVNAALAAAPESPLLRELNALMNIIVPDYPLLAHNRIEPLVTGDQAYPRMLDAIRAARHHIHLQTFIIGNDDAGREFLEALRERAAAGVQVRLLFDRFGSTHALLGGLLRRHAREPNIRIVGWTQANPLKRQFQINLRNHRKLLVIDGHTAFTGGLNLSVNNVTRPGITPDRDYHFALSGPIVQELQYSFLQDWYFMTDDDPDELLREAYFAPAAPAGSALIRLINGGPATEIEELTDVFFGTISQAQTQILAVTPYFVPPPEIIRALRAAAMRGVDVRLLLPARNNHPYAGLAGRALYAELLHAGVRIFELPPPFIHAKAMIMDDAVALVGTANLDVRSLCLNYESNLAVWDPPFVNALKRIVLEDYARGREIILSEWQRRPLRRRVAENFCSLLSPVL